MTATGQPKPCIFCEASTTAGGDASTEADSLVVCRGKTCFIILNLYPYNSGHLMVVPYRHVGSLSAASAGELAEMMALTQQAEIALTEVYRPDGLNVGMNLGRPAGAGVPDHLHIHVVPRWTGDTNFMAVVGNVRVLPEEPSQSVARLRPVFRRLMPPSGATSGA